MKYLKFNRIIIIIMLIILGLLFSGCNNTNSSNNNYTNDSNNSSLINNSYTNLNSSIKLSSSKKVEEDLSSFSTTIYIKDPERQNNINITCSSLNGTIIKSNEEFSFCNTVGKATPDKGYQKADIFDSDGNIVHGYGRWKLSN